MRPQPEDQHLGQAEDHRVADQRPPVPRLDHVESDLSHLLVRLPLVLSVPLLGLPELHREHQWFQHPFVLVLSLGWPLDMRSRRLRPGWLRTPTLQESSLWQFMDAMAEHPSVNERKRRRTQADTLPVRPCGYGKQTMCKIL